MLPEEIFTQLSLWVVNLYLKVFCFCLIFILYLHVWIRIRIRNTDPDPESSWIRIHVHNTTAPSQFVSIFLFNLWPFYIPIPLCYTTATVHNLLALYHIPVLFFPVKHNENLHFLSLSAAAAAGRRMLTRRFPWTCPPPRRLPPRGLPHDPPRPAARPQAGAHPGHWGAPRRLARPSTSSPSTRPFSRWTRRHC